MGCESNHKQSYFNTAIVTTFILTCSLKFLILLVTQQYSLITIFTIFTISEYKTLNYVKKDTLYTKKKNSEYALKQHFTFKILSHVTGMLTVIPSDAMHSQRRYMAFIQKMVTL